MAIIKCPLNLFIFFIFSISLRLCFSTNSLDSSSYNASNELANQVCRNTSNFHFCQEAIYADPRAPSADRYVLSYIAFGRAYTNATSTSNVIVSGIKSMAKNVEHDAMMLENLKKCKVYYKNAVRLISEALRDLDSDTFTGLGDLSVEAGQNARNCQVILKGDRIMSKKNEDLIGLSEVCTVVSKLYNVCC